MFIIVGYSKGEAFVVGHTASRAKAAKWVQEHPNGERDEYDYVESQHSHNI